MLSMLKNRRPDAGSQKDRQYPEPVYDMSNRQY